MPLNSINALSSSTNGFFQAQFGLKDGMPVLPVRFSHPNCFFLTTRVSVKFVAELDACSPSIILEDRPLLCLVGLNAKMLFCGSFRGFLVRFWQECYTWSVLKVLDSCGSFVSGGSS